MIKIYLLCILKPFLFIFQVQTRVWEREHWNLLSCWLSDCYKPQMSEPLCLCYGRIKHLQLIFSCALQVFYTDLSWNILTVPSEGSLHSSPGSDTPREHPRTLPVLPSPARLLPRPSHRGAALIYEGFAHVVHRQEVPKKRLTQFCRAPVAPWPAGVQSAPGQKFRPVRTWE